MMFTKNWICLVAVVIAAFGGMAQAATITMAIDYLLVDGNAIKTDGTLKEAHWFGTPESTINAFGIDWAFQSAFGRPPEGSGSLDHNGVAFTGNELTFVKTAPNCAYSNINGTFTGLTIGAAYRAQFVINEDHYSRMTHTTVGTVGTGDYSGPTTPQVITFDWVADTTSMTFQFGGSSGKAVGYDLYQVPEPATLVLLAIGGVGALLRRRR